MRIWKNVSSRRILSGVILVESSKTGFREKRGKKRKGVEKERKIMRWTMCSSSISKEEEDFFLKLS